MSTNQTKVTFASDYTTADGKGVYEGGETYSVDKPDARLYINLGKARLAEDGETAHREPTTATKRVRKSRAKAAPTSPAANLSTGAVAAPVTDTDTTKAGS